MTGDWYDVVRTGILIATVTRRTPHPCAYGTRTPVAGCDCGCNAPTPSPTWTPVLR